ncbi:hypothetical protein EC957_001291 [Mortierella hygrophila]|uniref:Uncharacterized protein n=1 Tax=Mortierella hygrophila TaxID=979708 RepID=A0A9P6F6F2_9FUNG|nr:hypothetical protein EC957_001291 [Mortierella hygrophila]
MDIIRASLASSLQLAKTCLATRRGRRFLLAIPIVVGTFLILSTHTIDTIDLGRLSKTHNNNKLDSDGNRFLEQNNVWRARTVAQEIEIPDSTWTCTDDGLSQTEKDTKKIKRSRQCVVKNLCVDRQGAFIRSSSRSVISMPEVNLMSVDESSDIYWKPRVERSRSKMMKAHYVDETLFVHGIFSPGHFSHWLYNGMLPLYSTMKRFNGSKDSWTFLAGYKYYDQDSKRNKGWEMRHIFQTGFELVLSQDQLVTDFQMLPPDDAPVCFRSAVVGLGSQCALHYCEFNIPAEIHSSFRDVVSNYYFRTPQIWEQHLGIMQESIDAAARIQQQQQAAAGESVDVKPPRTPLKCLELARYYNFEPSTGENPVQPLKESRSRVGQLVPDTVDPEVDHSTGKRRLVVAIIQREGSRRLLNDKGLVEGLAAAGYRVKWITLDHGCGLAETAYLLRDVHVLGSPHGNAIGASIFMPTSNPVPTVISLDASRYSESWFINTATAMGLRILQSVCGPNGYVDEATKTRCPYYKDVTGADKLFKTYGWGVVLGLTDEMAKEYKEKSARDQLTKEVVQEFRERVSKSTSAQKLAQEELDILIGPEFPHSIVNKYDSNLVVYYLEVFWRDAPRYADVPRVVGLMRELQEDQEREQAAAAAATQKSAYAYEPYFGYVRENRVCGVKYCKQILTRNMLGESRSYGMHSIDDPSRWGQSAVDMKTLLEGLEYSQNWRPTSLLS